jgi:ribosomal protein L11 methyltransferase
LQARRRYDLVCANLTSDLLLANAEKIKNLVCPGGRLVIAGVLEREFADVTASFRRFNLTLEINRANSIWKSGQLTLKTGVL